MNLYTTLSYILPTIIVLLSISIALFTTQKRVYIVFILLFIIGLLGISISFLLVYSDTLPSQTRMIFNQITGGLSNLGLGLIFITILIAMFVVNKSEWASKQKIRFSKFQMAAFLILSICSFVIGTYAFVTGLIYWNTYIH